MNTSSITLSLYIILPSSIGCHLGVGRQDGDLEVTARYWARQSPKLYASQILAKGENILCDKGY